MSLYEQRLDKGYSLTDCISMNVMKQLNITEVLSHDKHFTQEGFTISCYSSKLDIWAGKMPTPQYLN